VDFTGWPGPQPASRKASAKQPAQQFRIRLMSFRTAVVHAAEGPAD
jgi:hypothetical protein